MTRAALITPEIQSLALKLTSGKSNEKQKVDALYEYVSTNVRYVSISFGLGRFQPHQPQMF
jgi:transglutaminase-like putative cysteine protease